MSGHTNLCSNTLNLNTKCALRTRYPTYFMALAVAVPVTKCVFFLFVNYIQIICKIEMNFSNPIYIFKLHWHSMFYSLIALKRKGGLTLLDIMDLSHLGFSSFEIFSFILLWEYIATAQKVVRWFVIWVLSVSVFDVYLFWHRNASWIWADQHIIRPLMLLKSLRLPTAY